ncbi:hypothetical protein [Thalassobacillus hwangdonensis]|uniref:Uncharacterized protein n=1 Tax=Thalassobacillus hwangdonensis TaxID=546108 RepID=A0ABW3KZP2_9BACI
MNDMKSKLDKDLEQIKFQSQQEVLRHIQQPRTWKERFVELWNKEIQLPVLPMTTASVVLFAMLSFYPVLQNGDGIQDTRSIQQTEIIQKGGSVYWKDQFEEVKKHED